MDTNLALFGHTVGSARVVFGKPNNVGIRDVARVEPHGDADRNVLPMVFSVKYLPTNAELHLVASDFHGSTWTSTLSTIDLNNMVHGDNRCMKNARHPLCIVATIPDV